MWGRRTIPQTRVRKKGLFIVLLLGTCVSLLIIAPRNLGGTRKQPVAARKRVDNFVSPNSEEKSQDAALSEPVALPSEEQSEGFPLLKRRKHYAGRKYLRFERNLGRLNNQARSFSFLMRLAKAFNRTLVINGYVRKQIGEQWMGFRDCDVDDRGVPLNSDEMPGLWDMKLLRESFDFLLWSEVNEEYGSYDGHPILKEEVSEECTLHSFDVGKIIDWMAETVQ